MGVSNEMRFRSAVLLLILSVTAGSVALGFAAEVTPTPPAAVSPADVEFFEKQIRPVLAANCFTCHGPKMQMGGLRLDARDFLLKGGDHGPVLVPGVPEKSAILQAIAYNGRVQM